MFPGIDQLYQQIAERMADKLPQDWKQAWVTATVEEDHAKADYDYRNSRGEETWFDPGFGANGDIAAALIRMRRLMIEAGQPAWSQVRFTLSRDGKFHLDFGYPDGKALH